MIKYQSPLRYPGGKQRHIKHLAPLLPKGIKKYREPMCGGASMFFHMRTYDLAQEYWINDAFYPLMNFWREVAHDFSVKSMATTLHDMLTWKPERLRALALHAKEVLTADQYNGGKIALATYYFVVNRCSFSGSTLSGGLSPNNTRFIRSAILNMELAHHALQNVRIGYGDFSDVILTPGEDVFIFVDPPYVTAKDLYGFNGDMHKRFDHQRLCDLLRESPHKWMLTYDDCPQVREMYRDFNIATLMLTGSMHNPGADGKQRKMQEVVITNYDR